MAALAGEFEAVVGGFAVATAGREALVVRAEKRTEKTRSSRRNLRVQQSYDQVLEVCMLGVAESASDGLETPRSSGVAQTRR